MNGIYDNCFIPKCSEGQVMLGIGTDGCPTGCTYPGDMPSIISYTDADASIDTATTFVTSAHFQEKVEQFEAHIIGLWLVIIFLCAVRTYLWLAEKNKP
jgi:hypothetical protein